LTGQVLEAGTQQPVPAATIRLLYTVRQATAAADGSFSLPLPPKHGPDTLLVSRLGFAPLRVGLASLRLGQPQRLYLHPQQTALQPVSVRARPWVERQVGITSAKALVHFTDGTLPAGQPFEIAQVLHVGTVGTLVTAVHLYLAADQADSLTLAVRFYRLAGGQPGALLVEQPLYRRVAIRQGWLHLDLGPQPVYLTQDAVVGLTLVPNAAARTPVPVEIKLGGSAQSFARPSSNVPWRVPPHHYRLFATVRQPPDTRAAGANETENQETPATTHLYAPTLRDSFALFIHLPAGYRPQARRRYPVVVLLDGNVYADQVGAALRRWPAPEAAILVGVGRRTFLQQDSLRQFDYTYPAAPAADSMPRSGGGRQFLSFIEQELLPYLDRTYRTDPTQRTLMGHSLGGYFTLFALVEALKTGRYAFATYVAASPTLLYDQGYLLRELAQLTPLPHPLRVYLTSGTQELGSSEEGRATKAAFERALTLLQAPAFAALHVAYHLYPGYRHLDTAVPTFTTRPAEWEHVAGPPSTVR
jgi:predicted alpha/beta superfamily hydrolase